MGIRGAVRNALGSGDNGHSGAQSDYTTHNGFNHMGNGYGYSNNHAYQSSQINNPGGQAAYSQPPQYGNYGQPPDAYRAFQEGVAAPSTNHHSTAPPSGYDFRHQQGYTGHDPNYGGGAYGGYDGYAGSQGSKLSKTMFGSSSDWGMGSNSNRHGYYDDWEMAMGGKQGYKDDWGMGMGTGSGGKQSKSSGGAWKAVGKLLGEGGGHLGGSGDGGGGGLFGGGDGGGGGGGDGGGGGGAA